MTIQGVAVAAGTSAPSLRRRYRDKLELAMASIDAMQTQPLPEKKADPRAEALAILNNLRVTMIRRNGLAILASTFAERARHPELLAHFRQRVEEPLRQRLRQALSAGVETGQLPNSLDLDTAVSMLTGSLYAHYLNSQQLPEHWAEHTLRIVWPASPSQPGHLSAPARSAFTGDSNPDLLHACEAAACPHKCSCASLRPSAYLRGRLRPARCGTFRLYGSSYGNRGSPRTFRVPAGCHLRCLDRPGGLWRL
jgi:AcrR family transcriptional regulator